MSYQQAKAKCRATCIRCGAYTEAAMVDDLIDGDSIPDDPEVWNPPDNHCGHEDLRISHVNKNPCCVCGALPNVYKDDAPAFCPDHCPEHEYQYDRDFREWRCTTCDHPAPPDHYAYQD